MNTKPLLALLADARIHSGESLADSLGVSRTAVWKQIRKLQEKGIQIDTIRGRGYQLAKRMDLLTEHGILESLTANGRGDTRLALYDLVDSTNSDIARRWQAGETGTLVSIADTQQQGRGRRGRVWQSPVGQNLYMSLGVSIACGFSELDGLSLVVGVAVLNALRSQGLVGAQLKWPNDILVGGRKLAGILIELQGELEGAVRVIVGIGVNVHMTEAESVDQPWTSLGLAALGQEWRRDEVASAVIAEALAGIDRFVCEGFGPTQSRWSEYDVLAGRELVASSGDIQGVGRGVDENGNYLVEANNGLIRVHAGEISLRIAQ